MIAQGRRELYPLQSIRDAVLDERNEVVLWLVTTNQKQVLGANDPLALFQLLNIDFQASRIRRRRRRQGEAGEGGGGGD